jgi:hypothetical protein
MAAWVRDGEKLVLVDDLSEEEQLEMRDLIHEAQGVKKGDESELEELADLARKLLSQREVVVEGDDGGTSIVDLLTGASSTDVVFDDRLPAYTMRGSSRRVADVKRRLGIHAGTSGIIERCLFRMQDYRYGNRCGIWSIKLPGLKGEKINDGEEVGEGKGDGVEESVGYQAKNINIKIVRRKKMNKHKWKKLRRKYRNSTRHSRSKRKRNREELMKEYSYLGMGL